MAQKVEVVLTCDLDDEVTAAAQTVVFGYEGQTYEFELCPAHLDEFHRVMGAYVGAARLTGGSTRQTPGSARASGGARQANPSELAAIRQWARVQGYEINDRGRIPAGVREAYEAAQR